MVSAVLFNLGSNNSSLGSLKYSNKLYFDYLGSAKCSILFQRFRDLKKVEKLWVRG